MSGGGPIVLIELVRAVICVVKDELDLLTLFEAGAAEDEDAADADDLLLLGVLGLVDEVFFGVFIGGSSFSTTCSCSFFLPEDDEDFFGVVVYEADLLGVVEEVT